MPLFSQRRYAADHLKTQRNTELTTKPISGILRRYINSLEDKASAEAVTYGMVIPSEFRSEVLADIYAAQEPQEEAV